MDTSVSSAHGLQDFITQRFDNEEFNTIDCLGVEYSDDNVDSDELTLMENMPDKWLEQLKRRA